MQVDTYRQFCDNQMHYEVVQSAECNNDCLIFTIRDANRMTENCESP